MALICNATNETQQFKAGGNWFTLKPGQVKAIHDEGLAGFIRQERAYLGIIEIPEKFEDVYYRDSEEGKAELAAIRAKGRDKYIAHLRSLVYNNQVSLRQDLEQANLKVDPAAMASQSELEAMRLLSKYQSEQDDQDQLKIEEVKKLMGKIKK